MAGGTGLRWWTTVAAVTVLAVIVVVLQADEVGVAVAVAYQLPGVALAGAAILVGRRFGELRVAALLAVSALAWIGGNAYFQFDHPLARDLGGLALSLPLATIAHALLALPGGRLRRRSERVFVAAAYLLAAGLAPLVALLGGYQQDCERCPPRVLLVGDGRPPVLLTTVDGFGVVVVSLGVALLLRARWRRETPAGRRLLGPMLLAGAYATVVNLAGIVVGGEIDRVDDLRFHTDHIVDDLLLLNTLLAFSALALAVPYGVFRTTRAAGAFGRLVPRVAVEPTKDELRALVAEALGDPTVSIQPDPTEAPEAAGDGRVWSDVTFAGTLVARVEHDVALRLDPTTLETVLATLGLLLGRRRFESGALEHEDHLRRLLDLPAADHDRKLVDDLRRLRSAFDAYVDRDVARRVLESGTTVAGETLEVTVMFLDVRDFTSLSERSTPGELVALLNEFWDLVVPVVGRYGGHANKFIGDGLLAVFGAPIRRDDHADLACGAAAAIAGAVWSRYGDSLSVGIGLHTGEVVAGSVGGGGRLEFTVIGDTVNTASRVESATKATGDVVLATAATVALAGPTHRFVGRGAIPLKGKDEPVELHALAVAGA